MANIRLIKGRIKSVKNIAQITKAMELVAASKMKKAQAQATAGKLYARKIYDMVIALSSRVTEAVNPLLIKPKKLTGKKLVILFQLTEACAEDSIPIFSGFFFRIARRWVRMRV